MLTNPKPSGLPSHLCLCYHTQWTVDDLVVGPRSHTDRDAYQRPSRVRPLLRSADFLSVSTCDAAVSQRPIQPKSVFRSEAGARKYRLDGGSLLVIASPWKLGVLRGGRKCIV